MKWRKLGHIFDPVEHPSLSFCEEFAQSPQVLELEDRVRIYFSTRERDKNGKYLSHISFVEMTKDFQSVLSVAKEPVISLGELGCFDEHGIFPIHVREIGGELLAYLSGWSRRVSVSVETAIGLAKSADGGKTFNRLGNGPILSASLGEPFLVGDPFVLETKQGFHMWYIFGKDWKRSSKDQAPDRVYKIASATSEDGLEWQKVGGSQMIEDAIDKDECQALPTVVHRNGRYHMYFCFRHAFDFRKNAQKGYRIGYAFSDDLVHWKRADKECQFVSSEGNSSWDNEMMCYPHVFIMSNKVYMLYNGNEFGRRGFGLAVAED